MRTTDDGGLSYEDVFVINVTNENDPPTGLTLSNSTLPENEPAGTLVGDLSTVDTDVGDAFTYSLVSGDGSSDNGSFTIVDNQLNSAESFDYESKTAYSIRVRTTDGGGSSYEDVFVINIVKSFVSSFRFVLVDSGLELWIEAIGSMESMDVYVSVDLKVWRLLEKTEYIVEEGKFRIGMNPFVPVGFFKVLISDSSDS